MRCRRRIEMRIKRLLFFVCLLFFTFIVRAQSLKIGVITDLHYMDSALLIREGSAFDQYTKGNRVLLKESPAIVKAAVNMLIKDSVDLVLITGDLTKDGEYVSHKGVIKELTPLLENGIKVLVIPGNHDVNNPRAFGFDGDSLKAVATITPLEFRQLYGNFGYNTAIQVDANSLSYVSEPVEGLRIICIDDCENQNKLKTRKWVLKQIGTAKAQGKQVLAMMHHNVVEHFDHEGSFPYYMTDSFEVVQKELLDAGVTTVFTGHFHASDISLLSDDKGNNLYDVATGSLSAYPCPYRIVEVSGDSIRINTNYIDSIDIFYNDGFKVYARREAERRFSDILNSLVDRYYPKISASVPKMAAPFIDIPDKESLKKLASRLFPGATELVLAHYCGNENLVDSASFKRDSLLGNIDLFVRELSKASAGMWSNLIERTIQNSDELRMLKEIVRSIWDDVIDETLGPVNDLNLTIVLRK